MLARVCVGGVRDPLVSTLELASSVRAVMIPSYGYVNVLVNLGSIDHNPDLGLHWFIHPLIQQILSDQTAKRAMCLIFRTFLLDLLFFCSGLSTVLTHNG